MTMVIESIIDQDKVNITLEGKLIKVNRSKIYGKRRFKYCRAKANKIEAESFAQWMKDFRLADKVRIVAHDSGLFLIYKFKNLNYN